jgi:hypothetical protein
VYSRVTNKFKKPLAQAVIKLEAARQHKFDLVTGTGLKLKQFATVSATETTTVLCGRRWMFPEETVNGTSLHVCLQTDICLLQAEFTRNSPLPGISI